MTKPQINHGEGEIAMKCDDFWDTYDFLGEQDEDGKTENERFIEKRCKDCPHYDKCWREDWR